LATLVDTSALLALLAATDEYHARASATFEELTTHDDLVTHNYVIVESTVLVQRRLDQAAVRHLHNALLPPLTVAWIDENLHHAAVTSLLASGRRDVSLVDWVSFELMRRQGISTAFAFDSDFAAQGFSLIP
jgi:predicted nucleic acid-binding protein